MEGPDDKYAKKISKITSFVLRTSDFCPTLFTRQEVASSPRVARPTSRSQEDDVQACEHNIPETKKGAGPCVIVAEVKKRNGKPNWWCRTHSHAASAPDGAPLEACPGAWFDPEPDDQRLIIDLSTGETALWGAIPPAITVGDPPLDAGRVHVHHRPASGADKDIDSSFNIVIVTNGDAAVVVEGMAAVAFSISELTGQHVVALTCGNCGEVHIDEQKFATNPHRKHLCNHCGRNFIDTNGGSISNPLANIYELLGLNRPAAPVPATQEIDLVSERYSAIAVWPSNPAIMSTMTRPEESGIHVHAWDLDGTKVVDETFGRVTLDGEEIDPDALRWLGVQHALAHGAPVVAQACAGCGRALLSPTSGWIEPRTTHDCPCGASTRTRRKVFLNPLAEKYGT